MKRHGTAVLLLIAAASGACFLIRLGIDGWGPTEKRLKAGQWQGTVVAIDVAKRTLTVSLEHQKGLHPISAPDDKLIFRSFSKGARLPGGLSGLKSVTR